ncbi:hypothetical protein KDAU_43700 [Dictyobacter aurantiacus]|uniref:Uncharacterized protein n=1 Tax=Dictyobacter aurantiacus TaxID=1936993 RepID=A0A401ZJL5_9CHLR|nr:hypothetical protein KDAU_43700 [Dictyobacter aurantiacus]
MRWRGPVNSPCSSDHFRFYRIPLTYLLKVDFWPLTEQARKWYLKVDFWPLCSFSQPGMLLLHAEVCMCDYLERASTKMRTDNVYVSIQAPVNLIGAIDMVKGIKKKRKKRYE